MSQVKHITGDPSSWRAAEEPALSSASPEGSQETLFSHAMLLVGDSGPAQPSPCCPGAALGRNQPKPQMLSGDNVPGVGARPWGAEGLSSREGELGPST